jgi:hypothetical protein
LVTAEGGSNCSFYCECDQGYYGADCSLSLADLSSDQLIISSILNNVIALMTVEDMDEERIMQRLGYLSSITDHISYITTENLSKINIIIDQLITGAKEITPTMGIGFVTQFVKSSLRILDSARIAEPLLLGIFGYDVSPFSEYQSKCLLKIFYKEYNTAISKIQELLTLSLPVVYPEASSLFGDE